MARGVMAQLCHDLIWAYREGNVTITPELVDEVKSLSAEDAANKIAERSGADIVATLMALRPAFAQDVLGALPAESRERTLAAAPGEVSRQWQRNALYPAGSTGRMMEPVIAAYPPEHTVGETIESLRELVKTAFITYIYVRDRDERLLGIVTMRDLLFSEHAKTLGEVMLRAVFALQAVTPLMEAMKQVLDRH